MDSYYQNYSLNPDYEDEEPEPKVCICPDYIGTSQAAYCEACADWTDTVVLEAAPEQTAEAAAINRKLLENFNRLMDRTYQAMKEVA